MQLSLLHTRNTPLRVEYTLKYMNENDTMLVRGLRDSFLLQLRYYSALNDTVQKILGKLILSRGDFSGLKAEFIEKQRLLGCLDLERTKTIGPTRMWQERKMQLAGQQDAKELDAILEKTGRMIEKFLDGEEQLKKYLEGIIKKGA